MHNLQAVRARFMRAPGLDWGLDQHGAGESENLLREYLGKMCSLIPAGGHENDSSAEPHDSFGGVGI